MTDSQTTSPADALLSPGPALLVGTRGAVWRNEDGTAESLRLPDAADRLRKTKTPPILCHTPSIARRLNLRRVPGRDVLELFAFVRPAQFCLPTERGLAAALGMGVPADHRDDVHLLPRIADHLLAELADPLREHERSVRPIARAMAAGQWAWAADVCRALKVEPPSDSIARAMSGLEIWSRLPEWAERAPEPPPGNVPIDLDEVRARLARLLGPDAEARPQQADYASAVAMAFQPRERAGEPRFVIAEAGTGVGKTLGYIAPASVWAEKNLGAVWISTYTRNLQHQIDQELDRLFDDPSEKRRKVVVRKGRENFLCLLNLEEQTRAARLNSQEAIGLGLIARWAEASRDGAMVGGDLPGWLLDLVGRGQAMSMTDHRGECIYASCAHYTRCFIEHNVRRAKRADIVVANHALVMVQAALGNMGDGGVASRFVFDEGHHVFSAADSAFSGHLTGQEAAELRRWLRGAEAAGRKSRARGLASRLGDLVLDDAPSMDALRAIERAAAELPGEGWLARLNDNRPMGAAERFLSFARQQVYARAKSTDSPYGLEAETQPPLDGLLAATEALDEALDRIGRPMLDLAARLTARLDDEADELDTATRVRLDAMSRALVRRGRETVGAWRQMLASLAEQTPPDFVDWFGVERQFGHDADIGLHRHWIDPTRPFAEFVAAPAHGVVVTSATLRDGTGDVEQDWIVAERRTGAVHLPAPAIRAAVPSPFDYVGRTRVYVVRDVRGDDGEQLASAYRELFLAAGGGALGLFTSIARLRTVHQKISGPLEQAGLQLLAQHADGYDVSTLIDIFRAEEDSCLLGTDAVRDGVDVPGASLRLIVFDKVPWPRPDILHRARKKSFDAATPNSSYDDMLTRLRLKQAYGRLIRRATDRGVFVMLDPRLPSRLGGAFPPGVEIRRVGLAEAIAETRAFLAQA
ncbi:MAG: ATP-dependent DNA helicase [Alphaproteobacteria bacterium]